MFSFLFSSEKTTFISVIALTNCADVFFAVGSKFLNNI